MKIYTPAANIIMATLYLGLMAIIVYITKKSAKIHIHHEKASSFKYNNTNIGKALTQEKYLSKIQQNVVIAKSIALKYTLIGSIINNDKLYLLKEMFIISLVCVGATVINSIVFWPLGVAVPFVFLFYVYFEIIIKKECKKSQVHEAEGSDGYENQLNHDIQSKPEKVEQKSIKYTVTIGILSCTTLILVSQTMFSIYNSVSNLGLLNLGSVAVILAIDQLILRPSLGLTYYGILKLVQYTKNIDSLLLGYPFIVDLCANQLLRIIHQIQQDEGTNENFQMGASPTKKRSISPSKVPKAQLFFEEQTLMNLQSTHRKEHQNKDEQLQQIKQEQKQQSPIKELVLSKNSSLYFTSAQKQLFEDNIQNQNSQNQAVQEEVELTKDQNQFYSIQRLPKDKQNTQGLGEDGVILVEAGLNGFEFGRKNQCKEKSNTLDVDFSPNKRHKRWLANKKKKRQLIITGNSPYLEYLPDMMKKVDKPGKKLTTPSQPQISQISRKVL